MPVGYRGVVVRRKRLEGNGVGVGDRRRGVECENDAGVEGGDEGNEEMGVLEEVAAFEEVVVWDHEKVVEDDDGVVKGMEEWIRFAEAVSFS